MIQVVGELEFRILDKNGILERMFKKPMDSFVRNMTRLIQSRWTASGYTMFDTTNTSRSGGYTNLHTVSAPAGDHTFGIQVGSGTNPVSINDFKLQTQIGHGVGAGQLAHLGCSVTGPYEDSTQSYIAITRNFDNDSGSAITIREVGLVLKDRTALWYFLMSRDLTGEVEVLPGKTFVAQYTFRCSV